MSRHRFKVATQKEDIVGSSIKLMLQQKCKLRTNRGRNLNPMSRQDNEQTNNFKSQHENGSCD